MKVWTLPVIAALIAMMVVLVPGSGGTASAQDAGACGIEGFDVPDSGAHFDFTEACEAHDACYGQFEATGGTEEDRRACDQQFLADMLASCTYDGRTGLSLRICQGVAKVYFLGVRAFGWLTFNYATA